MGSSLLGGVAPPKSRGPGKIRERLKIRQPPAAVAEQCKTAATAATASGATAEAESVAEPSGRGTNHGLGCATDGPTVIADPDSYEGALEAAAQRLRDLRYAEAIEGLLRHLDAPRAAADLLRQCVESWQQEECRRITAEAKRIHGHEDEKNCIRAQLVDARERLREIKDKLAVEREDKLEEKRRRSQAEDTVSKLRQEVFDYHQETAQLKWKLAQAQAATRKACLETRRAPSREEVVLQLAKIECAPLFLCNDKERAALKKKLLLKWHPDKQPSPDHASLATQVMQELQNRDEWSIGF